MAGKRAKPMIPHEYEEYEAEFVEIVEQCVSWLEADTREYIDHYVEHAELEMAFELLCLDLMVQNAAIPEGLGATLWRLARALKLDEHSVYDAEFWPKFQAVLNHNNDRESTQARE